MAQFDNLVIEQEAIFNTDTAADGDLVWHDGLQVAAAFDAQNSRFAFGADANPGFPIDLSSLPAEFSIIKGGGNQFLVGEDTSNYVRITCDSVGDWTVTGTGTGPYGTFSDHLVFNGSTSHPLASVTTNTTLDEDDHTVLADPSTAPFTVTLPDASGAQTTGRIYNIKQVGGSANAVTLTGTGGDTIDGETSITMYDQMCLTVQSDGTNWRII